MDGFIVLMVIVLVICIPVQCHNDGMKAVACIEKTGNPDCKISESK